MSTNTLDVILVQILPFKNIVTHDYFYGKVLATGCRRYLNKILANLGWKFHDGMFQTGLDIFGAIKKKMH